MSRMEAWLAIAELMAKAANRVDACDLDGWLDCFVEDSRYHILSRENHERGLPLKLFQCDNKNMMRDRVLSLREANVVNIHRDQHVVGVPQVFDDEGGAWRAESGYAVYQTDPEGVSRLFSVGVYLDRVCIEDGVARFIERRVIVDTFGIQNMLSTPI